MRPSAFRSGLVAAGLLILSACAGTRPEAEPAPPATVAYPDSPAPPSEPASAPAQPATGSTYEPTPAPEPETYPSSSRQVDGFRVQVYASQTSGGAEQARSEAEAWWSAEQRRTGFVAPLDAYVVDEGGLYKVRMGAFTNRLDAEAALATVRTRFPDAFLVPDLVTVEN